MPPALPSWFEHIDLMQIIIVALLAYVAWSVRRFIGKVDRMNMMLTKVVTAIAMIVTEHKKNHPNSSINIDTILREEGS